MLGAKYAKDNQSHLLQLAQVWPGSNLKLYPPLRLLSINHNWIRTYNTDCGFNFDQL